MPLQPGKTAGRTQKIYTLFKNKKPGKQVENPGKNRRITDAFSGGILGFFGGKILVKKHRFFLRIGGRDDIIWTKCTLAENECFAAVDEMA